MKKLFVMFLVLVMALSIFAGCNETNPTDGPKDAHLDHLNIGVTAWPTNLDPVTKMGKTCTRWMTQVYDTLLYCNNDGSVTSYICESWKKLDDTTAEFKLKSGITFHNGYALTAEDIKYSFDRVLFDETGYADPNVATVVATVSEVIAVDELTVQIKTEDIDPILFDRLASMLGVPIVSKKYIEEVGLEKFGTNPVGTGPYKVDSISAEKLELSYYEGYYGEKPLAEKITYVYISEETALATALVTGEIDLAPDLAIETADTVKAQSKDIAVTSAASSTSHLLRFNTKTGICADKKLRQAMSLAIDRELLCETLWQGYATVPNGYNHAEYGQYYLSDYPKYEYNLEKAKQLVAESSYNGEEISLQLIQGYYAMSSEAAEAIVAMWKEAGINAKVEFVDKIKTNTITNVAFWSNGLRFSDPLGGLWALWGAGTGPQKDLWDAPARFNEVGTLMQSETDVAARNALYREMCEIWDDEVVGTILYCPASIYACKNTLQWNYVVGRALNLRAGYLTLA